MMNSCLTSLVLAVASPALAFQSATLSTRPSVALHNTLRDMASYPDSQQHMASYPDSQEYMSEFEAFDHNGAFSSSPRGGMDGRPGNTYMGDGPGGPGMHPLAQRGNPNARAYTQDGFDPYSAYGNQYGMQGQSNGMRGPDARQGMDYYGAPPGMMSGGGGGMNGVHNDNTLEGFSYSSRVGQQQSRMEQGAEYGGGPPPFYEYQGGGMEGGFDPRFDREPMMEGGMGMDFERQGGYPEFGGFDGGDMDLSRMGP